MKYAVWFVRLVFAAWFIPAGLNHFIPLFPQPMGNEPLSHELIVALLDSHLFDLVKAVEFLAGVSVLTGYYMPLMLVACMPVSFCVWYWDTPLQGWGSLSSIYGWAVLLTNSFLCLAYVRSYHAMLAVGSVPRPVSKKTFILAGRLLFGAWMLASGVAHFAGLPYPENLGQAPLAVELMRALADSRLLDVAMAIQLVAGLLIVTGIFVPLALCVVIPVNVCAAFWGVVLDHQPLGAALALLAVALNALLMLTWINSYKSMLQQRALALGETPEAGGNFDTLYAIPWGPISPVQFGIALIPLLLAATFYHFLVLGPSGKYALLILIYPAAVLVARLLQGLAQGGSANRSRT
jgi:uncharacterized membrane protein YphA (DoxX/SURF4 family)